MKLNQKHSPERNASAEDTYFRFLTRKRWKQAALFLACVVVFSTTYALILPAITLEQDTFCETEVHSHNEDCMEKTLICALQETEPDHVHTGECWSEKLICQETEHVHTDECYSDRKADLETADDWQKTLQNLELSGNAAGDSVRIAQSQLGYQESRLNYAVDENNVRHGYSRYNQWFYNLLKQYQSDTGNGKDLTSEDLPGLYDDWSVRFVQFVLTQAGVFTEEELAERYIREAEEKLLEKDTQNLEEETQTEQTADHVITDDEALEKLEAQIAWLKNDERFEYIYGLDLDSFQAGDIVIEKAVPDETAAAENEDEQKAEEETESKKDAGENQADKKADSSDDSEQAESEQLEADSRSPGIRISMVQEDDFLSARSIGKSAEGTVEQFEIDAQDPHWSLKGVYRLKTDAKSDPDAEDGDKEDGETPDGEETDPSETPVEADGKDEANSSTEKPKQNSELLHSYTYEDDELKIRLALRSKPGAQKDAAKAGAETQTSEDTRGTEEAAHDKEETEVPDYAAYQLKIQPVEDASVSEKVEQMLTEQDEVLQSENIFRIVLENGSETLPLDEYDARVSVQVKPAAAENLIHEAESESEDGVNLQDRDVLIMLAKVDGESAVQLDSEITGMMDESGLSSTFDYHGEPVLYSGSEANPIFTVEYYANIGKVQTVAEGSNTLPVIDTSGKSLPKNGNDYKVKSILLEQIGDKYKLKREKEWQELYTPASYEYIKYPNISYFDLMFENRNYIPSIIKVTYPPENEETKPIVKEYPFIVSDGDSKGEEGGASEDEIETIHFTNREKIYLEDPDKYILIKPGTTIRLMYEESTNYVQSTVNFFDYDISEGIWYPEANKKNPIDHILADSEPAYVDTEKYGINSDLSDSPGSNQEVARFAFGNSNTGTKYGEVTWKDSTGTEQTINKGNTNNTTAKNTTFGIVEPSLNKDKLPVFSEGIVGPDLFSVEDEDDPNKTPGKTYIKNINQLEFERTGDTYTLHAVKDDNGLVAADNLEEFFHPKCGNKEPYQHIMTNNFWPMDSAETFGALGHDFKFGDYENRYNRQSVSYSGKVLPVADDGQNHNSFFGMNYGVKFTLSENYLGPLEYYFFGDDDMWVFLDDDLICDIGGVHQSFGEYVNLRDYLPEGSKGDHELQFFYTERGASGSTCFMQFTLPSVSSVTREQRTGKLKISKKVEGIQTNDEFGFTINFTNKQGAMFKDDYSYTKYNSANVAIEWDVLIHDGGRFTLSDGEYIIIQYLPFGTKFEITEDPVKGSSTTMSTDASHPESSPGERKISGQIKNETDDQFVQVEFVNTFRYELPETGGTGVRLTQYGAGIVAVAVSAILIKKKIRK